MVRFSLKIFVEVVMSWKSSKAWGLPRRRERVHILPHSCHVGCALLYFLRPGTSSFAWELLRSSAFTTFSLTIPVLASIYRGLNGITKAAKHSHSQTFFCCQYPHGWLAHYFKTHHVLQPPLLGPLMVRDSELQMMRSDIGDVRELIHEGRVSDLGCLMLRRNRSEILIDMEIWMRISQAT